MPFDPSKPADHSPLVAAEMRGQFSGLVQAIADASNGVIAVSSNNSNGVATVGQSASSGYDQSQMQQVLDKLDELINALRRS